MTQSFTKDPGARKNYTFNWAGFLDTDTISASTWTVPSGLTEYDDSNTATTATIWLEGGIAGDEYLVVNQITTDGGVIDQRSLKILCREL